jgi:4,5-DOPA dioxygenase extradiol
MSSQLPALFVSHGSPMFALEVGESGPALTRLGSELKKRAGDGLRGVVIMSPHWMARSPAVMTNAKPVTWHDFGGFPQELYALDYPAAGAPDLASEVIGLLRQGGIEAQSDPKRPLDHGAWVPLMHLFPAADVPVVQVALPAGWSPAQIYAMGQALQPLRERGVLVIGTGSMTHNLGEFFGGERKPDPYVVEFSRWVESAVERGDLPSLLDYRRLAPHAQRAHPSDDHFLPIFFTLGAGGFGSAEAPVRPGYVTREVMYGMLAMDSFTLPALDAA